MRALYAEALAALDLGYERLSLRTRLGDTHILALGPEGAPPVVFLPGGNFLNPTCLGWFLPLARHHRLYAPDIVGQPGMSAQVRPSPKGDSHAFWVEDVLDGLGLERAPLVGLSYGAGLAIRTMGLASERVTRAALVSPAGIAALLRRRQDFTTPLYSQHDTTVSDCVRNGPSGARIRATPR